MKRALALLVVAATLAAAAVAFTQSFSVQLGNARGPRQPVRYSHQTHAGKLGMNCLYCHYGADRSPVANLPPVSSCMGCHKIALADKPEIMRLTAYFERGQPVPWVEVYHLPAYVRFDHARHVRAGFQCTDCHGPVPQMAVMYQYPSLKMGWCLTCHRQRLEDRRSPATMDCAICHH